MGGMTYCIRLVREKLRIFPYGQYIVGNVVLMALMIQSVSFKIEVGVEEKCTKMLTPFPMDFPHTPSLSMTSLSLARVYCTRPLLGRRVCKRVHDNIIVYLVDMHSLSAF